MTLLNKIKTRYTDYVAYKRKVGRLNNAARAAKRRVNVLIAFIKLGIKVEECKTCIEMEIFIYDSLVHSFATFLDGLSYEPTKARNTFLNAFSVIQKLEEVVAPYMLQQKDLTNTDK